MILNVWTVQWDGHRIEVRNHFFVAELLIDGALLDKVAGLFRHDLRATLNGVDPTRATRPCPDKNCAHRNRLEARFCAECGAALDAFRAEHNVLATVQAHFPPPSVSCRILVDGAEIFRKT